MALTGLIYNTSKENDREQWRRSLAEAGLTLVTGSFEEGATVSTQTDVVWYVATGQCYTWTGTFPHTAESAPVAGWVPVTDLTLRSALASAGGSLITGFSPNFIYPNETVGAALKKPAYFDTAADLIASSVEAGITVKTLGLRFKDGGGSAEYRIVPASGVRPESPGYKITSFPTEFGDLQLANGNIAVRLNSVKVPDKINIWAHRGGQRGVAENTLYSFSHAIQNGAHGVELDGGISQDGVWFVYHDAYMSELTNGTGYLRDLTSTYVDSLKFTKLIGTRFENSVRIPRFSTFLEWARENGVSFTVELKNRRIGQEDADFSLGVQMIVDYGCEDFAMVQVTTLKDALLVREISKQIVISYAFNSLNTPSDVVFICKDFENVIIQSNSDAINAQFAETVKLARALGSDVICYTSRDIALDINKVLEAGVRNIISDRGWENKK